MEGKVDYTIARRRMVSEQLYARGITDRRILKAFLSVPRHLFVDPAVGSRAYDDCAFPIGYSQTISQPYTVALMIQSLVVEPQDRVLEIGTGSGYQTAILSLLAKEVFSIERLEALFKKATLILSKLGTGRIKLMCGDGSDGWESKAPFDKIIVSAAMDERPWKLIDQLKEGGRMIVPIASESENLFLFEKVGGNIIEKVVAPCSFVPLKKGDVV